MSVLPPNHSPLEQALAQVTQRLSDIPTPLRELWNPTTCPENLLPWLAWAMGIDTWKSYWPLSVKREIIKNAVSIKRQKGTVKSVRDVASAFGAAVALRENWQLSPPGAPFGFDIAINVNDPNGQPVTAEFINDIISEITRTKPARSFFTVTSGLAVAGQLHVTARVRPVCFVRLPLIF
ncbi:phage tail protein I [Teredinibacter turnerae]|uniref:phage tail protein I n=1 Tax=Teredinibacter turnerae TaxID=2426 RepID=UPI00036ED9D7|nr:phage tail protein I [Teredinibacter turnerae]